MCMTCLLLGMCVLYVYYVELFSSKNAAVSTDIFLLLLFFDFNVDEDFMSGSL